MPSWIGAMDSASDESSSSNGGRGAEISSIRSISAKPVEAAGMTLARGLKSLRSLSSPDDSVSDTSNVGSGGNFSGASCARKVSTPFERVIGVAEPLLSDEASVSTAGGLYSSDSEDSRSESSPMAKTSMSSSSFVVATWLEACHTLFSRMMRMPVYTSCDMEQAP